MKTVSTLTIALACFACGDRSEPVVTQDAKPKVKIDPIPDKLDPYARPPGGSISPVVAMNRGKPPPDSKHPGSGYETHAPGASRTSNGFQIQFASASPVPTPAIHNGKLIVSGGFNSHEIYAYTATTGENLWARTLSDDGPSNPVCEGELCVFNSESCTTFAINAKTGQVKWAWWLGDPQTSSPTLANGLVFASYPAHAGYDRHGKAQLPVGTHALAAFDAKTGKPVWRLWLDGDVMSSPVAVDGFVFVTTFGGTVMKVDQKTGEIIYAIAMRATSAPVVVRDAKHESLFLTTRAEERPEETKEAIVRADVGETRPTFRANAKFAPYLDGKVQQKTQLAKLAKVDDGENGFSTAPSAANATVAKTIVGIESVSTMQRFQGSRVLVAGDLVVSTMGDEIVAVDSKTGSSKWSHKLPGDTRTAGGHLGTAPLLAGTNVIIATLSGDILRLDVKTGKLAATYKTGAQIRSQPAAEAGWIYVGTEDGRLIAINTGDKSVTGWPTWGGDNGRTATRAPQI